MQQILLFFGEKKPYTTLLGPARLLISEIFPSKPDFHLHSHSGVFSTGATGAMAPVILRKRLMAPVILGHLLLLAPVIQKF